MGQGQEEHPPSPLLDWSVFDEQSNANEDEVHEELGSSSRQVTGHASSHLFIILDYSNTISVIFVGRQRAPRNPRPPTKGKLLDNMTKAMGRRLPIEIALGKKRLEKLVQAAKLASEAAIVIRSSVPI
jgi:hypothetical protein